MFSRLCGLGAKKRSKPRVEFVQESDVEYFQQHIANIENKDYPDRIPVKTTPYGQNYFDQQVHRSPYLTKAMDNSPLNKRVQFHTPVKVKPQERSASVTPPNPNSNKNRPSSVNSQQINGKGENPRRVLTVLKMSRPFPASEETQEKPTTLSLSRKVLTNDRIPNRKQRLSQEKKLTVLQHSQNVPGIDNKLNHGQRQFQERSLRVSPYRPNLQPSPTTQLMYQSPMQNQAKNRIISGTAWLPSDGSALDAEYSVIPRTPELKRKVRLNQLLIKPIVTMKGTAYDGMRWSEEDIDTVRNFHSSCTDFLKIVMLTKAEEIAKKLKEFLCSDLIEPSYVPSEHIFRNRRLNHFHVFWNIMHQLPFYMKKWNKKTKAQLIWFYEVGIRETLLCPLCQKHFSKWLEQMPVSDAVGTRKKLNQWLFKLHDDVNRRSNKPSFQWKEYERRWGPNGTRNDIEKADFLINDESKQDDEGNSHAFGVSPHQIVKLKQQDFMLQRDIYAAANIYDGYPAYPVVIQVPPIGYASPFSNGLSG